MKGLSVCLYTLGKETKGNILSFISFRGIMHLFVGFQRPFDVL